MPFVLLFFEFVMTVFVPDAPISTIFAFVVDLPNFIK
jgi:hypothetical protein